MAYQKSVVFDQFQCHRLHCSWKWNEYEFNFFCGTYRIYTIVSRLDYRSTATLHVCKLEKRENYTRGCVSRRHFINRSTIRASLVMFSTSPPSSPLLFYSTLSSKEIPHFTNKRITSSRYRATHAESIHSQTVVKDALFTRPDGISSWPVFTPPT